LHLPIGGAVAGVNDEVITDPTLAKSNPHDKVCLLKLNLANISQTKMLMSADEYKSLIGL